MLNCFWNPARRRGRVSHERENFFAISLRDVARGVHQEAQEHALRVLTVCTSELAARRAERAGDFESLRGEKGVDEPSVSNEQGVGSSLEEQRAGGVCPWLESERARGGSALL